MKDDDDDGFLSRFPFDPEGVDALAERAGGAGPHDRWFVDTVDTVRSNVTEWALGLKPEHERTPSPDMQRSTTKDLLNDLRIALVLCGDLAAERDSLKKKLRKNRKKKRKIAEKKRKESA